MTRLSGKIAIVTGAGGGIGQAIAQRFAVEGAHVWVTDINGETAEETVRGIKAAGGAATAMMVDVSKGQDLTALVRKVGCGARPGRRARQQRRHSGARRGASAVG